MPHLTQSRYAESFLAAKLLNLELMEFNSLLAMENNNWDGS
jgi:hypothetical protein